MILYKLSYLVLKATVETNILLVVTKDQKG